MYKKTPCTKQPINEANQSLLSYNKNLYTYILYSKTKYIPKQKNRNTLEAYSETPSNIKDGGFCENSQQFPTFSYSRK